MTDKFRIHYEMEAVLSKSDLWSGGGAPLNPSVGDVLALIRGGGGILSMLDKWSLHEMRGQVAVTAITGDKE